MALIIAKVFKSGNSQAIRLPRPLRVRTKTVQIEQTARGLLILDPKAEVRRVRHWPSSTAPARTMLLSAQRSDSRHLAP